MTRKIIRQSQAIAPFGIGALVEFPGETLMPAGLEFWPDEPRCEIRDERMAKWLGVKYFRAPPPPPDEGRRGNFLPVVRFPLWHYCPRCRTMKKANWNDPHPPRCDSPWIPHEDNTREIETGKKWIPCRDLPERRRRRMIPVRFVVACERGHLDDFPWPKWAHSRPGQCLSDVKPCSQPLLRLLSIEGAGFVGLVVRCESEECRAKYQACEKEDKESNEYEEYRTQEEIKKSNGNEESKTQKKLPARSLLGLSDPKALTGILQCSGNRPWLGPDGREKACPYPPRFLQRLASNLYFPKIASSILIPPFSDPIRKIIDDPYNWRLLTSDLAEGNELDDTRLRLFAELNRLDLNRLRQVVRQKRMGEGLSTTHEPVEKYRHSEYQALLEAQTRPDEEFVTRHPNMADYEADIQSFFDRIVLVEKLAETRVLIGFSRINPPLSPDFEWNNFCPLSRKRQQWLPGVRVYGEGIFLKLNERAVQEWLDHQDIDQRYSGILQNLKDTYNKLNRTPRPLSPRFFLLHTLAHVLIRRLSYECGYGTASLRERLYCSEDSKLPMSGLLIYTAAGDSKGTMGGYQRGPILQGEYRVLDLFPEGSILLIRGHFTVDSG